MKKVAFFIALMVGLNATPVVRKPEEEESQAIVLKEEDNGSNKNRSSVIHHITNSLMSCFYAITKEGRLDIISWDRIAQLFNMQNTDKQEDNAPLRNNKTNWLLMNYEVNGKEESVDYTVLEKK